MSLRTSPSSSETRSASAAFTGATIRQAVALLRSRRAGRGVARAVAAPLPRGAPGGTRVLVAGDSTALGWGASAAGNGLVGRLAREFPGSTVDRIARSGARLHEVAAQLRRVRTTLAPTDRYDLVLVLAGGNDALRIGRRRRLRHDSVDVADAMVALASHAVWLGPADVSLSPLFVAPFDRWLSRRMRLVVDAIESATRSRGIRFIDFFAPRADDVFSKDPRRFYAADLVHPADDAYAYCYTVLRRACPLERWLCPELAFTDGERKA